MLPVSTFEVSDGGGELLCMEQKHCQRLGEINRYQGRAGASARQAAWPAFFCSAWGESIPSHPRAVEIGFP